MSIVHPRVFNFKQTEGLYSDTRENLDGRCCPRMIMQGLIESISERNERCDLVSCPCDHDQPVDLGDDSVGSYPSHIVPRLYLKAHSGQSYICRNEICKRGQSRIRIDTTCQPLCNVQLIVEQSQKWISPFPMSAKYAALSASRAGLRNGWAAIL